MSTHPPRARLVWTGFALALLWRAAAPWFQYREVLEGDLAAESFYEFAAFGVMGLGFLLSGWIAWRRAPGPIAWTFALFAALAAIHWGGPLGTTAAAWLVYFWLSGVAAQALFLHFALVYPRPLGAARRRSTWIALYGTVAAAAALTGAVLLTGEALVQVGLLAGHLLLPNLLAVMATVLLIVRFARASREERTSTGLRIAFWAVVLGNLPYLTVQAASAAGASLPGGTQPYNFFFLLIPIGLCAAVIRNHRAAAPARAAAGEG